MDFTLLDEIETIFNGNNVWSGCMLPLPVFGNVQERK